MKKTPTGWTLNEISDKIGRVQGGIAIDLNEISKAILPFFAPNCQLLFSRMKTTFAYICGELNWKNF